MSDHMMHITKNGVYVDGVPFNNKQSVNLTFQSQLEATYEGCHAWTFTGDQWYSVAVAEMIYSRWTLELADNVPEFVRAAEIMR